MALSVKDYLAQRAEQPTVSQPTGRAVGGSFNTNKPPERLSDQEMQAYSKPSSVSSSNSDTHFGRVQGFEQEERQAKEPGFLGSIGRGIADIALQPARFLERGGKAIGEVGFNLMHPEKTDAERETHRKAVDEYLGPGIQEQVGGKEYATPSYKNVEEFAGGALQAGANLATPIVGGVGKLALQGAALAGGKAMEENKSAGEVALSSVIGGGGAALLGKGSEIAGKLVSKGVAGVKEAAVQALKPVAKKLAPYLTGISKSEFNTAFNKHPELTSETLKILQEAGDQTEAEGILRGRLLDRARTIASGAKKTVGDAFDSAITAVKNEFPDATGDIHRVVTDFNKKMPRFGQPANEGEATALRSVKEIMTEPREYTIDGMRTLLQDLHAFAGRTDQGSPARRAAMSAWADVRGELSKTTNGKIDPAMKAYSELMDDLLEVAPVWSESVSEDVSRNFVKNLAGTEKTAALEALQRLGKRVGEDMTPDIIINRIAKKLAVDQKITGSRMGELLGAGALLSVGGTVGEAVGGEKGKNIAQTGAALLGAKALAPSALSKIILSNLDTQGVKMASGLRGQFAKLLENPATIQAILHAVQGGPDEPEE